MQATESMKSMAELQHIQQEHEAEALQEQERIRKSEQAEKEGLERQEKAERKQAKNASQSNINALVNKITETYYDLCSQYSKRVSMKDALEQKHKDYSIFLATKDEAYPVEEKYDEETTIKMRNKRLAYYVLPVLDMVFAWVVLLPLFQYLIMAVLPYSGDNLLAYAIATPVAFVLGGMLSFIGRLGVCSDESKRKVISYSLALIVPALYWICFLMELKTDIWSVTGFSLLSFVIQFLIIQQYPKHIKALAYFKDMKNNEDIKAARDKQNADLNAEIQTLTAEVDRQPADFYNRFYQEFAADFRNLATARRLHIDEYNEEPVILLDWTTIYVGNAMFFRRSEIPMPQIAPNLSVTAADLQALDSMFGEFGDTVNLMQSLLIKPQTSAIGENRQLPEPLNSLESDNIDSRNDEQLPPAENNDSDNEEETDSTIYTDW